LTVIAKAKEQLLEQCIEVNMNKVVIKILQDNVKYTNRVKWAIYISPSNFKSHVVYT